MELFDCLICVGYPPKRKTHPLQSLLLGGRDGVAAFEPPSDRGYRTGADRGPREQEGTGHCGWVSQCRRAGREVDAWLVGGYVRGLMGWWGGWERVSGCAGGWVGGTGS